MHWSKDTLGQSNGVKLCYHPGLTLGSKAIRVSLLTRGPTPPYGGQRFPFTTFRRHISLITEQEPSRVCSDGNLQGSPLSSTLGYLPRPDLSPPGCGHFDALSFRPLIRLHLDNTEQQMGTYKNPLRIS